MKNKKLLYLIYGLVAVLLAVAVIVAVSVTGENSPEESGTGSGSTVGTDSPAVSEDITAGTNPSDSTAAPVSSELTTEHETAKKTETSDFPVTSGSPETPEDPVTTRSPETSAEPGTSSEEAVTDSPSTSETASVTTGSETTDVPADTENESSDTTDKPADTTDKPAETADKPADTTDISEVTTETAGADTQPELNDRFTFTLSFAGDTQLADNYNDEKQNFAAIWDTVSPSYYLSKVKSIFEADDYSLLNLEFVLSDRELERTAKSGTAYWYKGPTKYIQALTCSSIEGLALTNNHTGDYGTEGEADTLACVLSSGFDAGTYSNTIYVEKNGYTVAIICDAMWYSSHKYDIIKRLNEAIPKSDFQVVYWHGGSKEYQTYPDEWEKQACYDLVDAGADLIIGNHPHVLQPMEYYKGVRILYSLGNFCYSGMLIYNRATVIYQLKLTVGDDGLLLDVGENIIPCYYWSGYLTNPVTGKSCQNYQPVPITNAAAKQQVMDFLNWKTDSPMLQ